MPDSSGYGQKGVRNLKIQPGDRLVVRGSQLVLIRTERVRQGRGGLLGVLIEPTEHDQEREVGVLDFDSLVRNTAAATYASAVANLKKQLLDTYMAHIGLTGYQAVQAAEQALGEEVRLTFKGAIEEAYTLGNLEDEKNLKGILAVVLNGARDRIGQEIAAVVSEAVSKVLTDTAEAVAKEVAANGMAESTYRDLATGLDILPDGTKFCQSRGKALIVVVEQKPEVRTVLFDTSVRSETDGKAQLSLSFPYLRFVLKFEEGKFSKLWVFYANEPLRNLDTALHLPNLPNTYADGRVCMNFGGHGKKALSDRVVEVLAHWWLSEFNNHLLDSNYFPTRACDPRLESFATWAAATEADPNFVLQINWRPCATNLKALIEESLGSLDPEKANFSNWQTAFKQRIATAKAGLTATIAEACQTAAVKVKLEPHIERELLALLQLLAAATKKAVEEALDKVAEKSRTPLRQKMNAAAVESVRTLLDKGFAGVATETFATVTIPSLDSLEF